MFFKRKQGINCFGCSKVSGVNVLFDFIRWPVYLNHCTVLPFVDILKQILDAFDTSRYFNVNVGIELPCQIGVVRYHPSIVKYKSTRIFLECSPIIASPINNIAIFTLRCCLGIFARITFFAHTIYHATRIWIPRSARPVQKTFGHGLI